MEKQYSFVYGGEDVVKRLSADEGHIDVPRIGEWVQLRVEHKLVNFVVKHVLYKFPENGVQRIIILMEKISEWGDED